MTSTNTSHDLRNSSEGDDRGAKTVGYSLRDAFTIMALGVPIFGALLLAIAWFMQGAAANRAADDAFVRTVASLDLDEAQIEDRNFEINRGQFFGRAAEKITGVLAHADEEVIVWSYCLYRNDNIDQVFVAFDARDTLGTTSRRLLGNGAARAAGPAALDQCKVLAG